MIAKIITGQISKEVIGPSVLSTAYYRIIHPDYESEILKMASRQARVADGKDERGNTTFRYENMYEVVNTDNDAIRNAIKNTSKKVLFNGFPVKDYDESSAEPDFIEIKGKVERTEASIYDAYVSPAKPHEEQKTTASAVTKRGKEKKKTPSYQDVVQEIEG